MRTRPRLATRPLLAAAVAAALLAPVASARAQVRAFTFDPGFGNTDVGSDAVGIDFVVNTPIIVHRLGVFAPGGQEIHPATFAYIVDRSVASPSALTALRAIEVAGDGQGTLVGGYRFAVPGGGDLLLPAGFQGTILQIATGGGPLGYEVPLGGTFPGTIATGGGAITFTGSRRGVGGFTIFPPLVAGPPAVRYAAGNFEFTAIPEPATATLVAGGLLIAGVARRRRR